MSQVVKHMFVDEKSDAAMDSGVCPSPDETYQSYFDAFPALSSCDNPKSLNFSQLVHCTNESCYQPPTPPPVWHQFKKRDEINNKTQLRYKSFSSSPTNLRVAMSPTFLPSVRNSSKSCGSAPSPTNSSATPNKRQKLNEDLRVAPDGGVAPGSKATTIEGKQRRKAPPPPPPPQQHQRSCPELFVDRHYHLPEFCCPQVTNFLATSVPFNGGLPPVAPSSLGASPQFVVPKCFKVGSWPGSRTNKRPVANNDVPLWACGEWFCTLHKSLQLGLLSAKVQRQSAAKISTPPDKNDDDRADADILPFLDAGNDYCSPCDDVNNGNLSPMGYGSLFDYGNDDKDYARLFGNVTNADGASPTDYRNAVGYCSKDYVEDYCSIDVVVDNLNNGHNEDDATPPPVVDVDGGADVGGRSTANDDFFDAPQFILHLINSDDVDNEPPDPKECNAPPKTSASSWPGLQSKAANFSLDSSCFWPEIPVEDQLNSNSNVPEFDLFPPVDDSVDNIKVASQTFADTGQEVGFCLPKLNLSAASNSFSSVFSCEKSPEQQQQQKSGVNKGKNERSRALAVPISPNTHFVPIKSESMEDAYFLKPAFDDSTFSNEEPKNGKGLAYLAESDYYVYLEPAEHLEAVVAQTLGGKEPRTAPNKARNSAAKTAAFVQQQSKSGDNFKSGSFASLPLKFRASKPGKMVQTEERYFDTVKNCEKYQHYVKMHEKFLRVVQKSDAGFPAVDLLLGDFSTLDDDDGGGGVGACQNAELRDSDFEIWACRSVPLVGSADLCQHFWWNEVGVKGARPSDLQRMPWLLAGLGGGPGGQAAAAAHKASEKQSGDSAELELWQKEDERDEELLLKYVSNISLISPLELTTCGGDQ